MDYIEIGSSPCDEPCAQLGKHPSTLMRLECRAYATQLARQFPNGDFRVKASQHDFGTYYEVWAYYRDGDAMEAAFAAESGSIPTWESNILAQLQNDARALGFVWTPEGWEEMK